MKYFLVMVAMIIFNISLPARAASAKLDCIQRVRAAHDTILTEPDENAFCASAAEGFNSCLEVLQNQTGVVLKPIEKLSICRQATKSFLKCYDFSKTIGDLSINKDAQRAYLCRKSDVAFDLCVKRIERMFVGAGRPSVLEVCGHTDSNSAQGDDQ